MSSFLTRVLKLGPSEKDALGGTLSRAKGIHEFLGDALEAVQGTEWPAAIAAALPWAGPLGTALGEALPPIKFALELFEGLSAEHEPDALGYLACTLAYQQSIEQALQEIELPARRAAVDPQGLRSFRRALPREDHSFERFSYAHALQHEFVREAAEHLRAFATTLGCDGPQARQLEEQVHIRFSGNLKTILSHGKTRERFAPFTERMALGTREERAYQALLDHRDHQRWLFEEQPVLGKEPFALRHVYVDTDCGCVPWGEIKGARGEGRRDPFDEAVGGRVDLIETVLEKMADPEFTDAIVIQGVAGSGKSSLTLRLCWELIAVGLRPIRIELKDLDTRESLSIEEALPEAVRLTDKARDENAERLFGDRDLFLGNAIFDETVVYRGTKISPHVLILDGWDEISLSASAGYQQQVERMLREVRGTFLQKRAVPVRVILTGRPTDAVEQSKFLRDSTIMLTVRPFVAAQLESYMTLLQHALESRPLDVETESWVLRPESTASILKAFGQQGNSVDVLGLPLIAHLTMRLVAAWPCDVTPLITDATALYRSLVDIVVGKGGKPDGADFDPANRPQITGDELRDLLRETAVAMTVLGLEGISQEELAIRLELSEGELDRRAGQLGDEHTLSRLMVSFFFKGGHSELGCEFSHKSFREYLFAEHVVERLKTYGRATDRELSERPDYSRDFDDGDPRRALSRDLIETLGPQWLSPEIRTHLTELLRWEIGRSHETGKMPTIGLPTASLASECWGSIRDALADLWDWWGEGVHLRPQVRRKRKSTEVEFEPPLVLEIIQANLPGVLERGAELPRAPRTTTIDGHLGDALCQLTAVVHYEVATCRGWFTRRLHRASEAWKGCTAVGEGPRRYQTAVPHANGTAVLFAPSGPDEDYFAYFVHRINACGYRPEGPFPASAQLPGVDLRQTRLKRITAEMAWFRGSNFSRADLTGSCLSEAVLVDANLHRTRLHRSVARGAHLNRADMSGMRARYVAFDGASMAGAALDQAQLSSSSFGSYAGSHAILDRADVRGAIFRYAQVTDTLLRQLMSKHALGTEDAVAILLPRQE